MSRPTLGPEAWRVQTSVFEPDPCEYERMARMWRRVARHLRSRLDVIRRVIARAFAQVRLIMHVALHRSSRPTASWKPAARSNQLFSPSLSLCGARWSGVCVGWVVGRLGWGRSAVPTHIFAIYMFVY